MKEMMEEVERSVGKGRTKVGRLRKRSKVWKMKEEDE